MTMDPNFQTAFDKFLAAAQAIVDTRKSKQTGSDKPLKLVSKPGRRYVKVALEMGAGGHMAYCFVDQTNGDILKSDSWKAPVKGARGNIYTTADFSTCVGPYGALALARN
jgi:hypothetical protein